ncbi:MAG: ATP-binding protein [Tannerella sp.]|jgi:hypothetical protein|nr:ATP-binding protein [Tannerella sp.]
MKEINPFITVGYASKEYFCDRENEVSTLEKNVKNSINTTLISPRRLGKTGLIYRFFDALNADDADFITIYVDIFSSRSLDDFIKLLAEAIMRFYPEKTSFGRKFLKLLKGFRPLISYDSITGEPQVSITYQTPQQKEHTLRGLLDFLDSQNRSVVLAIDEFQQIMDYPEQNVEALLRTYIQQLKNVRFIFCGSKTTLMLEIFSNSKRPFFSMTQYLSLKKIDRQRYFDFIVSHFETGRRTINAEAVDFILDWTMTHTYYTQTVCSNVFACGMRHVDLQCVKKVCAMLLQQNEDIFLQYRQLLTAGQWNFLIAIAKEERVTQITAQAFLSKYGIGTPANAKRLSKALINKDLLLSEATRDGVSLQVYDVFLLRWLQKAY